MARITRLTVTVVLLAVHPAPGLCDSCWLPSLITVVYVTEMGGRAPNGVNTHTFCHNCTPKEASCET